MAEKLPYVPNYGVISKALEKIKRAAAPPRFTQDFLATKLGMPGGTPRSVIPFLKRSGFLGSDGFRRNSTNGSGIQPRPGVLQPRL